MSCLPRRALVVSTALAAIVSALLLAACATADVAQPASTRPAGSSATGAFPVTVTAANGTVAVDAEPRRVVSLSATATEMLYAIGAGTQVVAVDSTSNYPARAPRTSLSSFKPNVEAIAKYDPDLVVVSDDIGGLVAALGKLKIPILLEPAVKDLRGSYAQTEQLGAATGHAAQAGAVVARMQHAITEILRATPRRSGVSVYHELDQSGFSATSKTFIGSVYAAFGLRNIADAAPKAAGGYPQLSAEYVISSDPDLIVLADTKCCGQNAKTLAARPGWSRIAAVRRGDVVALDDDVASRWGPRVVDFARAVGGQLAKLPAGASVTS